MSRIAQNMRRVSTRLTRQIALHWGDTFPMYYICEYPKSGGTWLGWMASDCLQLPYTRFSTLPLALPCVIHNHWRYHPRLRRSFYMYRDGRDVMVSFFFHRMTGIHGENVKFHQHRRAYESLFGKGYDRHDSVGLMAKFIEYEFSHPRDARVNWADHIRSWRPLEAREHVAYVSYEQLREDCAGHIKRVVEHAGGKPIDDWRVQMAVEKFSMERATGRKPGEEDRSAFIRKGVVGDWVNHFTKEAAELFNDLAGDVLVQLGYEADRGWVSRYDLPGS